VKKLGDFAKPENVDVAVQCMNELITSALSHIPDVITYLSRLRNQTVFNFCAIPQVGSGLCWSVGNGLKEWCWGWW
jgi:farnesyl-diphosphate farnesyltransferase